MHSIKGFIPRMEIILERGFFPYENLDLLRNDLYIIAASLVSKVIRNIFATASRTVDHADNVIIYNNDPVFCKHVEFTMNDLNLRGYFYHVPKRESHERTDFHRKFAKMKLMVEKLQSRSDVAETIEAIAFFTGDISYGGSIMEG